jgi:hypothetical protein
MDLVQMRETRNSYSVVRIENGERIEEVIFSDDEDEKLTFKGKLDTDEITGPVYAVKSKSKSEISV